jgi:hypothetical protein
MKFERNAAADQWLVSDGIFHMETWWAIRGHYQFTIVHDIRLDVYSASYKDRDKVLRGEKIASTFIGDIIHPETKLPYYATFAQAERACDAQYLKLQN